MTILEATVEITKAAIGSAEGEHHLLTTENNRKEFLAGIEALYKKLEKLDEKNLKP
jgi:hypothetical protein